MHKHDVKRGGVVVVVFLIWINCAHITHAFGVSAPYLENETLKVNSGKSYEYAITIENGDDRGYYVDIIYSSTSNIAELRRARYYIPSDTYNNTFYFDINIPKEAKPGDKYALDYDVKPRTNSSSPITLGVDINRDIKILVVDEKTKGLPEILTPEEKIRELRDKTIPNIKTGILAAIIIILIIIIINRIWKLSKGISSRFGHDKVTNYTISEAKNLVEVRKLLEKMNDDEFDLSEIKNIFKVRIAELTTHKFTKDIKSMSRKDIIRAINKIK
jgi:hypothetical protein